MQKLSECLLEKHIYIAICLNMTRNNLWYVSCILCLFSTQHFEGKFALSHLSKPNFSTMLGTLEALKKYLLIKITGIKYFQWEIRHSN